MSKIAVIGPGYVGLVAGAMLSDFGHTVICVDKDETKIDGLKNGIVPIYEPGLSRVVESNLYYKRLSFSVDMKQAVEGSDIIFIAVGTPAKENGEADLKYVLEVAGDIARYMNGYKVIVDKSTVPVGTGKLVEQTVREALAQRGVEHPFDVVSNPEFLREGAAVYDFSHPDRVVIGTESSRALNMMKEVYRVLYLNETPFIETNLETAEMIKYASNAFLAVKITYINEIANLCEKVGANVKHVAKAMGKDGRISPKFLHAGPGYGGSCFPKDTRALVDTAHRYGERMSLVETAVHSNEQQKLRMVEKVRSSLNDLKGKRIAVLGITFKPETDDMRDAPSLVIVPELARQGAELRVFDPQWEKEGPRRFQDLAGQLTFCRDEYEAAENADGVVILTEWNQFRNLDFDRLAGIVAQRNLFDFRNMYDRKTVEEKGFQYCGVGC